MDYFQYLTREEILKFIEEGANINEKDKYGRTPLQYACCNGYGSVVSILLEKGANVNEKNNGGYTPLNYACLNGHTNIVEILLDNGSEVEYNEEGKIVYDMNMIFYSCRGKMKKFFDSYIPKNSYFKPAK